MRVDVKPIGEVEILDEEVIHFPEGIIGFEHLKNFALINHYNFSPFCWLISIERADLAIPVVNPFLLMSEYQKKFPRELMNELHDNNSQYEVFCVVTLQGTAGTATLNLKGPILIDYFKKVGKQIILPADMLPVNYPLN
jgi:flagellar assembly factor FliW